MTTAIEGRDFVANTVGAERSADGVSPGGWYIVGLLTALAVVSALDRYILGLIAEPMTKDLGISDAGLGLLLGSGFALLYALAGFPVAYLIDRQRRKPIVVAGVIFWSLSTGLSAFATDMTTMFLARAGVAMGETVLAPAAVSMIGDLFRRDRRAAPMSTYSSVGAIMISGTLVIGAALFDVAEWLSPSVGMAPWRLTLILVSLPGLILAAVFAFTVREPVRVVPPTRAGQPPVSGFMTYLAREWRMFAPLYVAIALLAAVVSGLTAWLPTMAIRGFGLSPSSAGYLLGITGIPTIVVGSFFWPWLAVRIDRAERDGLFLCFAIAVLIATPLALVPFITLAPLALLVAMLTTKVCFGTLATMPPLIIQVYGRTGTHGRLVALHLFSSSVIGFSAGPLAVPWLGGMGDYANLALMYGAAILALGALPVAGMLLLTARKFAAANRTIED